MYLPCAKHEQEKMDIVNLILSGATTIEVEDDLSPSDLEWIKEAVNDKRR
jgi:hypothetical protein